MSVFLFRSRTHLALFLSVFPPVLHAPLSFDYWLGLRVCLEIEQDEPFFWGGGVSQMGLVKSLYIWLYSCPSFHTQIYALCIPTALFHGPGLGRDHVSTCIQSITAHGRPGPSSMEPREQSWIHTCTRFLTRSHTEALCSRTQRVWTPVVVAGCQSKDARESGPCQV